jgi:hypothetical protein
VGSSPQKAFLGIRIVVRADTPPSPSRFGYTPPLYLAFLYLALDISCFGYVYILTRK